MTEFQKELSLQLILKVKSAKGVAMFKFIIFSLAALFIFGCASSESESGCTTKEDCAEGYYCSENGACLAEVPDTVEVDTDEDSDPVTSWDNQDDDGDGIRNGLEGREDFDGDGIPNYLDTDSDGDGILDSQELGRDSENPEDIDQDGAPNFLDLDSDGDGLSDKYERGNGANPRDSDGDGVVDYRDTDDDDDEIPTIREVGADANDPRDSDHDGTPDYLDSDSDGDGVKDRYEMVTDSDGDGIPNYLDTDSDNDSIPDGEEAGNGETPVDSDGDLVPDFLDTDSDNDGLLDKREKELGTNPTLSDTDDDGFDDNTEVAAGSNPIVSDADWWDGKYYVILPYNNTDHEIRELDFSTDITKADILFMVDLSGSMDGEISNLKSGISNTLIDSIKNKIPDAGFGINTFDDYADHGDKGTRINQYITTNESTIKSAVNTINTNNGAWEPHINALYYSAKNESHGTAGVVDCSLYEGSIGGACFRDGALPIFIMMTDESFVNNYNQVTIQQAYDAMNQINAKFIGINSGTDSTLTSNLKAVSTNTGSVDASNNPFFYTISSNGSGLSTQIADGVSYLASNVPLDVLTTKESIVNAQNIDVTQFIKAVKPNKRTLTDTSVVTCSSDCSETTFFSVKPGTTVTFDIDFYNDFFEPTTTETTAFRAKINVFGEGSILDVREVYIIVPGKDSNIQ